MSVGEEHMNVFERMINVVKNENWKTIAKSVLLVMILAFIMCSGIWATIGSVISSTLEKHQVEKKQQHDAALQMRRDIKPKVDSLLIDCRHKLQADRTFIIEMHNGTSNAAGLPFLYGEMTYETVSDSVASVDDDYANLLLSRFKFAHYFERKHVWYGTVDELSQVDPKLAQRLASNDVTYLAMVHIHGVDCELGYLGVTYCNDRPPKCNETLIAELMEKSQIISTLLDIHGLKKRGAEGLE